MQLALLVRRQVPRRARDFLLVLAQRCRRRKDGLQGTNKCILGYLRSLH